MLKMYALKAMALAGVKLGAHNRSDFALFRNDAEKTFTYEINRLSSNNEI